MDHRIPQLAVFLLDLPNINILDRIATGVELDRSSRRVGNLHSFQRREKFFPVLDVSADRFGAFVDPARYGVTGFRVVGGNLSVLRFVLLDEALVHRSVDRGAVDERRDRPDRLVAERRQYELIKGRAAADDWESRFESRVLVLLGESEG